MTWEYRCVKFPTPSDFRLDISFKTQYAELPGKHTDLLNELAAEGWEWFYTGGDLFYFRRRIRAGACCEESHMTLRDLAEKLNEGNESRTVDEVEKILAQFFQRGLSQDVYVPGFATSVNPDEFLLPGFKA